MKSGTHAWESTELCRYAILGNVFLFVSVLNDTAATSGDLAACQPSFKFSTNQRNPPGILLWKPRQC